MKACRRLAFLVPALTVGIVLALCVSADRNGFLLVRSLRDPDVLWRLLSQRCATDPRHRPCLVYDEAAGYALLKDLRGRGQILLLPTKRVTGIEGPELARPETPNYIAQAWAHRALVGKAYGVDVPDDFLSLAVNSRRARSQDQLHLHLDCLDRGVRQALTALPRRAGWRPVILKNHAYRARYLTSLDPSPFRFVDAGTAADHTLLVTKAAGGGFLLVDGIVDAINPGKSEELQDHRCRISSMAPERKTP